MRSTGPARRLRPLHAVLVAALTLAACGRTDQPVGEFLQDAWPEGASGTVIAARGGEQVLCDSFGMADPAAGIAADCDTVYDVMSITKQFTAAAVLKLQMQGKLQVTDPVSAFLGPVPGDKRDITLHHLLTHTAGLVEALGDDYDPLSREDMIAAAFNSELRSPPGAEYRYSNLGYSLLAAVIEAVSGMGYEEFLAQHLFAPAGMTQTGYVLPQWDPEQVAVEHDEQGTPQGRPFEHPWAADGPYWNLRGNGGLLSTPQDMLRWHFALEGIEILADHAKALLFEPHVPEDESGDTHYGYGWVLSPTDDGQTAWHDGGNGWSLAMYARLLDDGTMVFWVSNHAYQTGEWDLEDEAEDLTLGIAERVRDQH